MVTFNAEYAVVKASDYNDFIRECNNLAIDKYEPCEEYRFNSGFHYQKFILPKEAFEKEKPVIIEKEVEKIVEVPSGPSVALQTIKTVTQNGTYGADAGYDGMKYVTVNVPEVVREIEVPIETPVQPILQTLTVTENGEYEPDEGYDGLGLVSVAVPEVIREVERVVETPADPILQAKVITENGVYSADAGYDGLSTITVNVINGTPEGYEETSWQEYQNWKLIHFTNYMGPESSQEELETVYPGSKIIIEVSSNNTTLELSAVSGSIEWGDGSYQTITEESKNQIWNSIKYDRITHRYNVGTYTLYFSDDFHLLNSPDTNVSSSSYTNQFSWSSIKIKAFGGKQIKDLDYVSNNSADLSTLETIELGVENIQAYAFHRCTRLTNLTLPISLKIIEGNAFEACTGLKDLKIPTNGELKTIGVYAFTDCPINNLILPAGVAIGYVAFNKVKNLKLLETDPLKVNYEAFTNSLQSIYVPYSQDHSVLNAYKTTDGWSNYANIIYESDPE